MGVSLYASFFDREPEAPGYNYGTPTVVNTAPQQEQDSNHVDVHIGSPTCTDGCLSHSYLDRDAQNHPDSELWACDGDPDGFNMYAVAGMRDGRVVRTYDSNGARRFCGVRDLSGRAKWHKGCSRALGGGISCGDVSRHSTGGSVWTTEVEVNGEVYDATEIDGTEPFVQELKPTQQSRSTLDEGER